MNKIFTKYFNNIWIYKISSLIFFWIIILLWLSNATYNCNAFNKWNWLYEWLTINENNLVGDDCSNIIDYYKGSEANGIQYSSFLDKINQQSTMSYSEIRAYTWDFMNIYESKNGLEYGWTGFSALLWYNKWITFWTKDLFIWPNIQFIFPFKPIYTNLKYVPVIVYTRDKQLPTSTNLKLNIYVSDKDMSDTEENISMLSKAKLLNVSVWNWVNSVFWLNIDELRWNKKTWSLYVYVVAKNIYWNKSTILKSKITYNRVKLKSVLWYTPDYVDYNHKKWTRNADVSFLYLYTNLKPKDITSDNNTKISLSEITAWAYTVWNDIYKYRSKIYLYDLKQGLNNIAMDVEDIYWNVNKNNTIPVYVDSKWPVITKVKIDPKYSVLYQNKVYINPEAYKKNGWFDMSFNVHDEATKTVKVIVRTDLWKKIVIDMKDWQDYDLKQLETSFDSNGEKVLQIEAYDILWNISKTTKYYNTLNISYPVITFTPKDNLIVVNNSLDFKGICSWISEAQIKFQLNDNPESDWINYKGSWDVNQLLKKWYNLFKVKCKNIVWESAYVKRIVIYEPKENIGWRNNQLEMYPSESKQFIMTRSNKNADNATLKVTDPTVNRNIPWFTK